MANDNGEKVQLERRVVRCFLKTENKRGWVEISVVDWVGGAKTYRLLEKREMYTGDDGQPRQGKAKGFNKADFMLLLGQARDISGLLGLGHVDANNPTQNASQPPPPPPKKEDPF